MLEKIVNLPSHSNLNYKHNIAAEKKPYRIAQKTYSGQ